MPLSPCCHFERTREIFFVRGRAKAVRKADHGKHHTPNNWGSRCFMQTALRRKTKTGNEKDPSAAFGMTKRENASSHFFSFRGSQPPPSARPFFKGLLSCHVKAPLVKTTKREYPHIVISSGARNLPCTPVKQREWDDDKQNTPGDASDNDTKNAPLTSLLPPALNPSPLYAKIELSLISLLIKSIAGIGFS